MRSQPWGLGLSSMWKHPDTFSKAIDLDPFLHPSLPADCDLIREEAVVEEVSFPNCRFVVCDLVARRRGPNRCHGLPQELVRHFDMDYVPTSHPPRVAQAHSLSDSQDLPRPRLIANQLSLGLKCMISGDTDECIRLLQPMSVDYPRLHIVRRRLGLAHLLRGDYISALSQLLVAGNLSGSDVKTCLWLGWCHALLKDPIFSLLYLSKVIEETCVVLDPSADNGFDRSCQPAIRVVQSSALPLVFDALILRGFVNFEGERFTDSLKDFAEASVLLPHLTRTAQETEPAECSLQLLDLNRALCVLSMGKYQDALTLLEARDWSCSSSSMFRSRGSYLLGVCYQALERWDDAVVAFTESLGACMRPQTLSRRAEVFASMGRTDSFQTDLDLAWELCLRELGTSNPRPGTVASRCLSNVCRLRAAVHFKGMKLGRALQEAHSSVRMDVANVSAWEQYADILVQIGEVDQCLALLEKALGMSNLQFARFHFLVMKSEVLRNRKVQRLPEAVTELRRAIAIRPLDVRVRHNLASLLMATRDFEGAKREYSMILRELVADPQNRVLYLKLMANAYACLNQHSLALENLDEAVKICNTWELQCFRIKILRVLGDFAEAVQSYSYLIFHARETNPPIPLFRLHYDRAVCYCRIPKQFELANEDFGEALRLCSDDQFETQIAETLEHFGRHSTSAEKKGEILGVLVQFGKLFRRYLLPEGDPRTADAAYQRGLRCLVDIRVGLEGLKGDDPECWQDELFSNWQRFVAGDCLFDTVLSRVSKRVGSIERRLLTATSEQGLVELLKANQDKIVCVAFVTTFWMWYRELAAYSEEFAGRVVFVKVNCLQSRSLAEQRRVFLVPSYHLHCPNRKEVRIRTLQEVKQHLRQLTGRI